MIRFLQKLKENIRKNGIECTISEPTDELIHSMPYVILNPISEKWEFNLLGNPDNKNVKFKIYFYAEHINGNYGSEIEEISHKIAEIFKSENIKKEILNYLTAELKVSFLEENTLILVTFEINLKLHRRSEWE